MARPIKPTPLLENKDAEKLYKEAEKKVVLSKEKRAELARCESLYHEFYSRLLTAPYQTLHQMMIYKGVSFERG